MKALTAAEMREVDRLTTERYGIPSLQLMEEAGKHISRVVRLKLYGNAGNASARSKRKRECDMETSPSFGNWDAQATGTVVSLFLAL